jgi:hydroxyethylthiazole kinase-like uncharacterized protein yjeF
MKVATTEQMREIEQTADAQGHTYATMMDNAGKAVATEIQSRFAAAGKRVLVLVGPGNNGGDGLVAARYLHDAGAEVQLYIWKRTLKGDENFRLTEERNIPYLTADGDEKLKHLQGLLSEADLVMDALLGTGVSRPLRGTVKGILEKLGKAVSTETKRRLAVVAVDVPTGVDCDTGAADPATVAADLTVTMALPKRGFFHFPAADYVGEVVVSDIGIPPSLTSDLPLELLDPPLVAALLPPRPRHAHKGTFGKAMIVAGSPNYTGAAYLASAAATRVGAGLVTLALAQSLHPILASKLTEVTFLLLPHDLGALVPEALRLLAERLPQYDALLVGPGLGTEDSTVEFVHGLLGVDTGSVGRHIGFLTTRGDEDTGGRQAAELPPLVIDADGLNALAQAPRWWQCFKGEAVLTPHPGEMSRLLDCSVEDVEADRIGVAAGAAQEWKQVVILKGAHSILAAPDGRVAISPFANPSLATAGTGDVLAGSIVGFLAQGLSLYDAAAAALYLHGAAGDMASDAMGSAGTVASDLLPLLPQALKALREAC